MPKATILVVDDEALIRWSLTERLHAEGYEVLEAETGKAALEKLPEGVDLVLLDYRLPDTDGVSVLRKIKEFDQDVLVILLTAYASVDTAVEAMKLGAYHFANKPFNLDEVTATVERALETTRLRREVRQYRYERRATLQPAATGWRVVGDHGLAVARRAGGGESGLNRPADRRERHRQRPGRQDHSLRQRSRLQAVHEHHLLGASRAAARERAVRPRARRVHRCAPSEEGPSRNGRRRNGLPRRDRRDDPGLQAKLLRFLEEKSFKRVGGSHDIRVDVRVVAATNRNLEEEVAEHRFRSDLFFRLNVLPIEMPPLRARPDDIPLLVEYFIDSFNTEFRKRVHGATPSAYALLQGYGWPGNVRELRNVIERAMLLSDSERLDARDFTVTTSAVSAGDEFELPATGVDLEKLERSLVVQALKRSGGNQTKAGTFLGLNRDQIRYRIEKFGLTATTTR